MHIIGLGNQTGIEKYCQGVDLTQLRADLLAAINSVRPQDAPPLRSIRPIPLTQTDPAFHNEPWQVPRRFGKLPSDPPPALEASTYIPDPLLDLSQWNPSPLKFDWKSFAYTDGSVLRTQGPQSVTGTGAGVYMPGDGYTALHLGVEPGESAFDDTINRAELAAIHVAISHGAKLIATDSQTSIDQILKITRRPQDLREHRHYQLLQDIARLISQTQEPIQLFKVKSHVGIVGNEIADEIAVAMARGEGPQGPQRVRCDVPSNERQHMHWPHTQPSGDANCARQPALICSPLPNLDAKLIAQSHRYHKLGQSNRDSIYYKAWASAQSHLLPQHSHTFISSGSVTHVERRYAIQYRTGGLYTSKLAHRYGHRSDSNCPLCGQPDGAHHAVSACPAIREAVTKRHNDAGMIIAKAIMQTPAADSLVMMDLGPTNTAAKHNMPLNRRIPLDILPPNMPAQTRTEISAQNVPDMLLYTPPTGPRPATYTIIEIKYCRDTDPSGQQGRAIHQHEDLQNTLRHFAPTSTVRLVTIPLGVSGAIYTYTRSALHTHLSIQDQLLETTLKKLHLHAVRSLTGIIRVRRFLEGCKGSGQDVNRHRRCKRPKEPP